MTARFKDKVGGPYLVALLVATAVLGAQLFMVGASAQEEPPAFQYLEVAKTVDGAAHADLIPGESFTYVIQVRCSEASCLDARLVDELPGELEGYSLQAVNTTPAVSSIPRTVTWSEGGTALSDAPDVVGPETTLRVDFEQPTTDPIGTGLEFGFTFTVSLTLQVPTDLDPGTYDAENTAVADATNSLPAQETATVTVEVAEEVDVDLNKSWTPSSAGFAVGAASRVTLTATNTSNMPADELVVQEPTNAPSGADSLDASNPFTITDLTGLSAPLPSGATAVQVDAYVESGGTWNWVAGEPSVSPELPSGILAEEVAGLRFTYTGAIEAGATAPISLDLALRETHRSTDDDLSTAAHSVTNTASATLTAGDNPPATATDSASYTVTPPSIEATALKDISPNRISAGDTATATITGTNSSDVGVNELRLSDLDYFTEDITFGGFTGPIAWPAGATGGEVIYHLAAGGTETATVPDGGTEPAEPSGPISGFELVFTAPDGGIDAGALATASFTIETDEGATGAAGELLTSNTVEVEVTAPNGVTASDSFSDTLDLVEPGITVTLDKNVVPSTPVRGGDAVVVELEANLTTTSDYVTGTEIVIEDAWDGSADAFWDAFNLRSIPAVQLPGGTALEIEVQTDVGDWVSLANIPSTTLASLTEPLSALDIDAALLPETSTDVTGVRFTFTNNAPGFADDTTVVPYLVTTPRSTLRAGGGDVATDPDTATEYTNSAIVEGSGETEAGSPVEDADANSGVAGVIPGDGTGTVGIDKYWDQATVPSQSGEQRSTTLDWIVGEGFETVTITDPSDPTSVAGTVFNAFDLVAIPGINYSGTPFTNGWYLRYDSVIAILLYREGVWQPVTAPSGGWMSSSGFVGYTLSEDERQDTTGVRLVLEENTGARIAAQDQEATYDPFAPEPGTGVASSPDSRQFRLTWQVRNVARDAAGPDDAERWVTGGRTYNTADEGLVDNTVSLRATIEGGPDVVDSDSAGISLIDLPPGVVIEKTVSWTGLMYTPVEGTDPATYPTATFTITANNDSVARASYVKVSEPPVCVDSAPIAECQSDATASGAASNPYADLPGDWLTRAGGGNPFDRFDLTGVTIAASIPGEVSLSDSVVWLVYYDSATQTFGSASYTAGVVNSFDASDLEDVVGISVTFQGADPDADGGTISQANNLTLSLETQLRSHLRSSGEPQILGAGQTHPVTNRSFAQSFDPVLAEGIATGDQDPAGIVLTGGVLDVAPTKSVVPSVITEPQRDQPVTVTIGANHGSSTVSPDQVWLRDDSASSPDFWDRFNVVALGAVTPPSGADQIQISVYGPFGTDGAMEWQNGPSTSIADAVLPVSGSDLALIEGVRVAFARADGGFFSPALPAPGWSASVPLTVELRDTYRSTGEPIDFPADTDLEVTNTVTAQALRGDDSSEERTAAATVTLTDGTRELSVKKLANNGVRAVNVGENVPWDLTFTNSGTGYLTITELRDTLPQWLVHLGDPTPVYTPDPAGMLSDDVTLAVDDQDLVFTWPAGGQTMAPGETFTIRLYLELQPGAGTRDSGRGAINTMTVWTAEQLDACSHIDASGETTGAWDDDPHSCGATDYVEPIAGPNLFTVKGVQGSLDGAYHPTNPAVECNPTLEVGSEGFYRAPCVANSVIGGTDQWALRVMNAGTVAVEEMVIFDGLPAPGDLWLVSGAGRGSQYRPQVVAGSLDVDAPAGTAVVIEVTDSDTPCANTWANLVNQEPCEQNGETWDEVDADTDWSSVTGIRVRLDFRESDEGAFQPSEIVDITFDTLNVPVSDTVLDGAPTEVPADDALAWNGFGVKYRNAGSTTHSRLAPSAVGVHLLVGSLQINKVIAGDDASRAPDEFYIDVSCTVEGAPISMGAHAEVILDEGNEWTHRIDGIPFGAECEVTEQGAVGSHGESRREGSPSTVRIDLVAGVDDPVPAEQVVTITNFYDPTPPGPGEPEDPEDPTEPGDPGEPGEPGPDGPGVGSGDAGTGDLPRTGAEIARIVLLGLLIMGAGVALVFARRWVIAGTRGER